jgi:iron complex outermembrane receptor protein
MLLVLLGCAGEASAQVATKAANLPFLSLEDLMDIEITSVSRKEQRLGDVPAAVYVITSEDIRRSGMTTLPELFRRVPGMQVARINSNKWAMTVRGFNNLFADKVLVLIDGRTMYDRLNSSVFWESIDVPLDLIDRIEVIRGPGGATWGANAVNGVINIVTKPSGDTPGAAVTVTGGTTESLQVSARYGGSLGDLSYRVNSQWSGHGQSRLDADTPANDRWESQTHGIRLDWSQNAETLMVEAGTTLASLRGLWHPPVGPVPAVSSPFNEWTGTHDYHVLGRWTHQLPRRSTLEVQSFVNFRENLDPVNPRQLLADVEVQYQTKLGARHDVVAGAGYRFLDIKTKGSFEFSIAPSGARDKVVNAFVQDEIALGGDVRVTLGAKVERDTHAGWGLQPTARVMWTVVPKQHHLWTAVSRSRHTPSLGDVSGRYNYASFVGQGGLPVVVGALGNPDYQSEQVVTVETGYRLEAGSTASIDVTAFVGNYDQLKTNEPLPPRMELTPGPPHLFIPTQFGNLLGARTTGVEIAGRWAVASWWRLEGGYSMFRLTPHLSAQSRDIAAASFDGNVPRAQWQARSAFSIGSRVQADAMLFHTGALPKLGIDAYLRADVRVEVQVNRHLSAALVGQNLLDPRHAEYGGNGAIVTATEIPRSAELQMRLRF